MGEIDLVTCRYLCTQLGCLQCQQEMVAEESPGAGSENLNEGQQVINIQ